MIGICEIIPKGKNKFGVRFDNGVILPLYKGEIKNYKIQKDAFISEEIFMSLLNEVVGKRAKKRAMHLLEQQDRTEKQLRDKLFLNDYPEECIDMAIDYVKQYNYLNDVRYAECFVRLGQEKYSKTQLCQKLLTKGIKKEIIYRVLEDLYETDEDTLIYSLLAKRHYDADKCDDKEFNRTYQYLLRRGFASRDILKAMKKNDL